MSAQTKTAAILVAAGAGTRAGGDMPKQYRPVGGRAVVAHALDALARHPAIDLILPVIAAGQDEAFATASCGHDVMAPVNGGATRRQSVRNALEALALRGDVGRVLIHDAARPFLPAVVVDRLLAALDRAEGAVPALPVVDSLIRDGEPVDRAGLMRVQTPQAFRFDAILAAHRGWDAGEATDDATILRAAGQVVATVDGDRRLEKLTTMADFEAAEARLMRRIAVGTGFDVHRLEPGEELWLGGVLIPHDKGLSGHSDADVALHALTDAVLGAIGDGDIGAHFPPSDLRWKGARSGQFLQHAAGLVRAAGGRIEHVDLTIICEAPKIGPHRQAMRMAVATLLGVPVTRVSIKATTTERLGFAGRGEGIAAQAAATLALPRDPLEDEA